MNRTFFSILFFSLLKRVIISITVLLVTRILLDSNWAFLLKPLSLLHFLPNKQRPYSNKGALARKPTQANAQPFSCLLDFVLSAMDRIPLSVGDDRSGASSSKQPSFDLNVPAVGQAVYEQTLEEIKNQKQTLADLLDPLIKKEARKYPDIKKLPSPTDVVEQLISRIGSNKARAENDHNAPLNDFRNLKTWLTRACQNAEDETKGRMSIRSEIRAIIQEYSQNDSEN